MPTRLAAARAARGLTQEQLLRAMRDRARPAGHELPDDVTLRVSLSRWENGHHQPDPLYRRLLAEALETTEADLGFAVPESSHRVLLQPGPDAAAYLEAVLTQHIQADRLIGSFYLIGVVQEQFKIIEMCLNNAGTGTRPEFLRLANRYAEFCGWLNQDQGRYADAETWTRKALDFAQALDDGALVSYTLMRRSNIASDARLPQDSLTLAEAALRPTPLTPRLRAIALRQKAAAHALLGEERGYRQSVDDGLDAASDPDELPMTLYCTVPYMKMEAGAAALELRQPRLAVEHLAEASETWPAEGHARDRALCLARLARAHALMRDLDRACFTAEQAIAAQRVAPSARTAATLRALRGTLTPHRRRPDVKELRQLLTEALP